jgi:hypothetical protein
MASVTNIPNDYIFEIVRKNGIDGTYTYDCNQNKGLVIPENNPELTEILENPPYIQIINYCNFKLSYESCIYYKMFSQINNTNEKIKLMKMYISNEFSNTIQKNKEKTQKYNVDVDAYYNTIFDDNSILNKILDPILKNSNENEVPRKPKQAFAGGEDNKYITCAKGLFEDIVKSYKQYWDSYYEISKNKLDIENNIYRNFIKNDINAYDADCSYNLLDIDNRIIDIISKNGTPNKDEIKDNNEKEDETNYMFLGTYTHSYIKLICLKYLNKTETESNKEQNDNVEKIKIDNFKGGGNLDYKTYVDTYQGILLEKKSKENIKKCNDSIKYYEEITKDTKEYNDTKDFDKFKLNSETYELSKILQIIFNKIEIIVDAINYINFLKTLLKNRFISIDKTTCYFKIDDIKEIKDPFKFIDIKEEEEKKEYYWNVFHYASSDEKMLNNLKKKTVDVSIQFEDNLKEQDEKYKTNINEEIIKKINEIIDKDRNENKNDKYLLFENINERNYDIFHFIDYIHNEKEKETSVYEDIIDFIKPVIQTKKLYIDVNNFVKKILDTDFIKYIQTKKTLHQKTLRPVPPSTPRPVPPSTPRPVPPRPSLKPSNSNPNLLPSQNNNNTLKTSKSNSNFQNNKNNTKKNTKKK